MAINGSTCKTVDQKLGFMSVVVSGRLGNNLSSRVLAPSKQQGNPSQRRAHGFLADTMMAILLMR